MSLTIPTFTPGRTPIPDTDGKRYRYAATEARSSDCFDTSRHVIFVNGMANTGQNHVDSAMGLSQLQMCEVIGVYNKTEGALLDLVQCAVDKYQFHGAFTSSASEAIDRVIQRLEERGHPGVSRDHVAMALLEINPASASMFELLSQPEYESTEIFAHSQGNIILCNALHALVAAGHEGAVEGRTVNTFGSPVVPGNWPRGLRLREFGFSMDPVTWLGGPDWSLKISKVGWPRGRSIFEDGFASWLGSKVPITHAFEEYMRADPAFVVNRFRWGSFGVTLNMDEAGLADALLEMGRNFTRVRAVLEYLEDQHPSDSDDVAVEYVEGLQDRNRAPADLGGAVKGDAATRDLLIRLIDSWWVGSDGHAALRYLRG